MKDKCYVCKVMCNIRKAKEQKACAFEHNGDENICPFDARYLDLSEHDKQIRAEVIEEYNISLKEHWIEEEDLGLSDDFFGYVDRIAEQLKEQK